MDLAGTWRYSLEDNPDFSRPSYDDSGWETMHIPQNWFLAGRDHHGAAWFRTDFRYRTQAGKFARLRFAGVDYFADVYLNGEHLGSHSGYFEPFAFEVAGVLRSGKNVLAVRVDSPYETPGPQGWYMHKKLIKGILNHHDCRPGGGWGGEGQAYNTGGIWNRVSLEEHGPVTIEQLRLRAELETKTPVLRLEVSVRNQAARARRKLEVRCAPENFKGKAYQTSVALDLPKGESRHQVKLPVPEVVRWNPWDRGDPNLYTVSLSLDKFSRTESFGFRTVEVGKSFEWTVNGEPYFVRGSNYIASQWLAETLFPEIRQGEHHPFGPVTAEAEPSWFERDVALARQANLNLLRVHAHVLPPEFHAACDRAGMLVWQDFPLQWGYSDEPDFIAEAERQLGAMLDQLGNHPSVAAWCCHNESPVGSPWMAGKAGSHYNPDQDRSLDDRLEAAARKLDPTRYVHKNSGDGDGHAYPGWYFGHWREFRDAPGAPFVSEYGAQGLPVR